MQVLVMEEGLFAFGICLDFCNISERPPYLDLDVDYVLIPSCGNETTMSSHVDRSGELMIKLKARTVVVQQHFPPKPDGTSPLGYVLARLDADRPALETLVTNDPWHIRVI